MMNRSTFLHPRNLFVPMTLFVVSTLSACGPSRAYLHQQAKVGIMPDEAVLHTVRAVSIAAPPSVVWDVLSDVDGWPTWHSVVRSTTSPKHLAVDESFIWDNDGTEIESRLAEVTPNRILTWTGKVSIASAVHTWRIDAEGEGTRVEVEESMWGFLLSWFYSQSDLDQNVEVWLKNLKKEGERRARETVAAGS